MKKETVNSTYDQWILAGYEHFASLGPSQLSVRKISTEINQPRTSFYYYFKSQQEFLNELLNLHWDVVSRFLEEARSVDLSSCPEMFRKLEQFPNLLDFHHQLFKNREVADCHAMFDRIFEVMFDQLFFKILQSNYSLTLDKQEAKKLMMFTAEVWFSRLYSSKISLKRKLENLQEIMGTISVALHVKEDAVLNN